MDHWVNGLNVLYPFFGCGAPRLFPVSGHHEKCCYEHWGEYWKGGAFLGQVKALHRRISQESIRKLHVTLLAYQICSPNWPSPMTRLVPSPTVIRVTSSSNRWEQMQIHSQTLGGVHRIPQKMMRRDCRCQKGQGHQKKTHRINLVS